MPDQSPSQLTGNLETMNLADLLQWLCLGQKTGTLHLQNQSVRKQVYILQGKLVSAGSNLPRERLGQFLLHHGRITESNLRAALSEQKSSGKQLGQIFCGNGILDKESLTAILQLKAEETIYDLFIWDEGDFHFVANDLPDWAREQLSLDVTGLIMEGVRRKDEMALIRQVLPSDRIRLAVDEDRVADAKALLGFDRHLLDLVRQRLTIAVIRDRSRAPEFVLLRRLHEFVEQGLLVVKDQTVEEVATPGPVPSVTEGSGSADDTLISPTQIPVLKNNPSELMKLQLSAEEGFIISRIDGVMDIRSVVQMSPVSEEATLAIFRKLLDQGVIDLATTGDITPRKS